MESARSSASDYAISREGEALLAADLKGETQLNPERANDILFVETEPSTSEFNDIHLDDYSPDSAGAHRDEIA